MPPATTTSLRSAFEFEDGLIDGGQRRGACRVGRVIHAAKVEPVGRASGCDIEQNSGKTVLGPLRQPLCRFRRERSEKARHFRADGVLRTNIAYAAAGAENNRRALVDFSRVLQACIRQTSTHDFERHQLKRVDGLQRARRNSIAQRIEQKIVQEAAPARVDVVGGGAVLVEVEPPIPAFARNFDGALDLVENVVPQLVDAFSLREDAGNADDRDVGRARAAAPNFDTRRGVGELGRQQLDALRR